MEDRLPVIGDIDEFLALDAPEAVAVAVSGGPDSMALGWLLSRWAAEKGGVRVHVLSIDHALRPESKAEAEDVGTNVAGWPCVTHSVLTRSLKGLSKSRIMEEARDDRYALLAGYCAENNIPVLFVAHHLDDQAETFLFRLAKGSGIDGLAAMRPVRDYSENLKIVRPFLNFPKKQLVALCKENDVPFITDPSNDDRAFARVRLRRSARVLAEEGLTPKRLAVSAARMRRAQEALDLYAVRTYQKALINDESSRIVLDYNVLLKTPDETRFRILQMAADRLRREEGKEGNYGLRMEKLENLQARIFADDDYKNATLGGLLFSLNRKDGTLTIAPEKL